MTQLIVPVFGEDIDEVRRQVEAAIDAGANVLELRLDLIGSVTADDIRSLRQSTPREIPFILTIRSIAEGGQWDGDDNDRVSRLIELGPFVDYIDVELALWRRSANIRQKIELALHRADQIEQTGGVEMIEFAQRRKLILSHHDQKTRPQSLHKDWVEMISEPACLAPKMAWRARTIRDNFEAFELMRDCPRPAMAICMGSEGIASRILAKKFGAFGTFAALQPDLATAPGQLTLDDLRNRYRWDTINADTAVFGVIGDPVAHSLSPAIHNSAFADANINAVYLPLQVAPSYESFKAFMVEVMARPWAGFRGFSVTIPHKENALRFIQESNGRLDPLCQEIGAINTISLNPDTPLSGHNTDHTAIAECLKHAFRLHGFDPKGKHASILGAGGVARSAVAALQDLGAAVTIYNRTRERADVLAANFNCRSADWHDRTEFQSNIIVNCTSIGMTPDHDSTPLPSERFRPGMIIFDTIYRPRETRLLREARDKGCVTLSGIEMFISQAIAQFRIWTARSPEAEKVRRIIDSFE